MDIKKLMAFVLLFLLGFGIIFLGQAILANQNIRSFTPQNVSFEVNPPAQALSGNISSLSGDVKKLSRTGLDFAPVNLGGKVLHGESVATGEDGVVTVTFDQFAQIDISKNSKITFVATIPTQFSVRQTQGQVFYQTKNNQSVSVRNQHLLLTFNGQADFNVDEEKGSIEINLLNGVGALGVTDADGQSNRWDIKKGQKVLYDDETRSVEVIYL